MRGSWDYACPVGVSFPEHIRGLFLFMVEIYFSNGLSGSFVVHPLFASMFNIIDPARFGGFEWDPAADWPAVVGRVGGIEIWVEPAVAGNEILICDDPESLQARAVITLSNFDHSPQVLDRLAQIPA